MNEDDDDQDGNEGDEEANEDDDVTAPYVCCLWKPIPRSVFSQRF